MAISYIGGTSANATTTSLPSGSAAGDLVVVCASRTNTAGPGLPAEWPVDGVDGDDLGVIAGGAGGNQHGQRVAWKILTADDITAGDVGQFGQTVEIGCVVYRGASAVGANSGTGASSTVVTFPARTGLAAGSWQIACGSHRNSGANTLATRAVTNYTNRSSGFTSDNVGFWDSNGSTSGIAQQTATVSTSSGNVGRTLEVTEAAAVIPSGSGTGEVVLGGSGSGSTDKSGSGTGAIVLDASGEGSTDRSGSGDAILILDADNAGQSDRAGSGTGEIIFDGSGVGSAPEVGPASGSGTAEIVFDGAGTGSTIKSGFGTAEIILSGSGTGSAPAAEAGAGYHSLNGWWLGVAMAGHTATIPSGPEISGLVVSSVGSDAIRIEGVSEGSLLHILIQPAPGADPDGSTQPTHFAEVTPGVPFVRDLSGFTPGSYRVHVRPVKLL